MENQLPLQDHGETNKQWYKLFPERLQEEAKLVQDAYPNFILQDVVGEENVSWIGEVRALRKDGSVLSSLEIKIECPINYPYVFPRVYDPKGVLKAKGCPHLTHNKKGPYILCYGNRLDSQLDFVNGARVKDVIDYVGVFLAKQWYYENYGEWLEGQAHGILPFLDYECRNTRIDPEGICPCGLEMKQYKSCHMPDVQKMLNILDVSILTIWKQVKKIGRNDECVCGESRKWKKCCSLRINYPDSKTFLALKYPIAFGIKIEDRDTFLKSVFESANSLALKKTLEETSAIKQDSQSPPSVS